jgi:hypothetical protein
VIFTSQIAKIIGMSHQAQPLKDLFGLMVSEVSVHLGGEGMAEQFAYHGQGELIERERERGGEQREERRGERRRREERRGEERECLQGFSSLTLFPSAIPAYGIVLPIFNVGSPPS